MLAAAFSFDLSVAERLYDVDPPTRRSARLRGEDGAQRMPAAGLGLTCRFPEAAAYHPWNADAVTRAAHLVDEDPYGMDTDDHTIRGYNSFDDSTFSDSEGDDFLVDTDGSPNDDSTFGSSDGMSDDGENDGNSTREGD